jgi:hypothetical protein
MTDFDDLEDFDDDDDDENREDLDSHTRLPVFRKAEQIAFVTKALVDTIEDEKDELQLQGLMLENAFALGAKIAGAEGGDLYSIRIENAVIIKHHARELLAQTSLCKRLNLCDPDYLLLLRNEIEEFRKLFVEWVSTFDKTNDVEDEWDIFK